MTVKAILDEKGRAVLTFGRGARVSEAVKVLAERRIGAVVIVDADGRIEGILSERDIVREIANLGGGALERTVDEVMTSPVHTCREESTVNEVMEEMTRRRFRHLPVESDGKLAGIISIGDVVKRRIQEVEREAREIRDYIATA